MRLLESITSYSIDKFVAPNPDIVPYSNSIDIAIGLLEEEIVRWLIKNGYSTEQFSIKRRPDKVTLFWNVVNNQQRKAMIKSTIYYDNSIKHTQAISVAYKKEGKRFEGDSIDFVIKIKTFLI